MSKKHKRKNKLAGNSPVARDLKRTERFWDGIEGPLGGFLVSLVFILLISFLIRKISCWDIWYHLKTGQYILENINVPVNDIFSYTASSHQWINANWLFQVIAFLAFSIGGIDCIIMLKILCYTLAFICLLKLSGGKNYIYTSIFIFLAVILTQFRFFVRPEMMTFLFIGSYLLVLQRYIQKDSKLVYLLPVLQLIWVNSHGLFVLGLFIVLSYLIGELLSWKVLSKYKWYEYESIKDKKYKKLIVIFIIMIIACFINPYGVKLLQFPLILFKEIGGQGGGELVDSIAEYLPAFSNEVSTAIKALHPYYIITIILTALTFIVNIRRIKPAYIMLYISTLYISLIANRNIAVFAFVGTAVAILNINEYCGNINICLRKKNIKNKILFIFASLLVIILSTTWIVNAISNKHYLKVRSYCKFGFGIYEDIYPSRAVDFIINNEIKGNILNNLGIGGYLIWRMYPERKIFIDGRSQVYGQKLLEHFFKSTKSFETLKTLLEEYNINIIIFNHISVNSRHLSVDIYNSNEWELVFFDDTALIFLKDTEENRSLIDNSRVDFNKLKQSRNSDIDGYYMNYATKGIFLSNIGYYENAVFEFNRALRINPYSAEILYNLGVTDEKYGFMDEAIEDYRRAIELDAKSYSSYLNRGIIYSNLGRFDEAENDLTRAIKIDNNNSKVYFNRAILYERMGLLNKSIEDYDEAIQINPSQSEIYSNRGIVYEKMGLISKSISDLTEAIRLNPSNVIDYNNRGVIHMHSGQYEDALSDFHKAIEIDSNIPQLYWNIAYINWEMKKWDVVIIHLKKLIEIDSEYPDAKKYLDMAKSKILMNNEE